MVTHQRCQVRTWSLLPTGGDAQSHVARWSSSSTRGWLSLVGQEETARLWVGEGTVPFSMCPNHGDLGNPTSTQPGGAEDKEKSEDGFDVFEHISLKCNRSESFTPANSLSAV